MQGFRKWLPQVEMPEPGHIPDVPDEAAVTAFLRALRPAPDAMARDGRVPFSTAQKWYLAKPMQPSVVSFLRVIVALGAEGELALVNQLREWRAASGEVVAASKVPAPPTEGGTTKKSPRTVEIEGGIDMPRSTKRSAAASEKKRRPA